MGVRENTQQFLDLAVSIVSHRQLWCGFILWQYVQPTAGERATAGRLKGGNGGQPNASWTKTRLAKREHRPSLNHLTVVALVKLAKRTTPRKEKCNSAHHNMLSSPSPPSTGSPLLSYAHSSAK